MRTPAKTTLASLIAALALCPPLLLGGQALAADAPAAPAAAATDLKASWYPKRVDLAFVKTYAVVPKREDVTIVDSRPAARKYDLGHIPTAVNIPDTAFDKLAPELLPKDKAAALYFYCEGLACVLSNDSATKAMKLGYTNVKVVPEGYPGWEKAYGPGPTAGAAPAAAAKAPAMVAGKEAGSITTESFERIYKEAPTTVHLIDVRSPAEHAAGTFKGSINMPLDTLEKNMAKLPADKPIIFFCGAGSRSGEAYDLVKLHRPELKTAFLDTTIKFTKDGTHTFGAK